MTKVQMALEVAREVLLPDGSTAWTLVERGGQMQLGTVIGMKVDYVDCVREAPEGLILEFGVAGGKSLTEIARHAAPRLVYGFDWWRGLPHDWEEGDPRGSFACDKPTVDDNVILVDGLFSDTLEPFLHEHRDPVGLLHIDCDLYCGCAYVLDSLADRFGSRSLVMFDEIGQAPTQHGERRAWDRFRSRTLQKWELIGKQHAWGEVWRKV